MDEEVGKLGHVSEIGQKMGSKDVSQFGRFKWTRQREKKERLAYCDNFSSS